METEIQEYIQAQTLAWRQEGQMGLWRQRRCRVQARHFLRMQEADKDVLLEDEFYLSGHSEKSCVSQVGAQSQLPLRP